MRLLFTFFSLFFTIELTAYPHLSQEIKTKKIYPMGEKIYTKKCKKINATHFESYDHLVQNIETNKPCGKLSPKYTQAVALYLWDHKRSRVHEKKYPKMSATKEEKCPVCGMFLYKYPTWIARIYYTNASFGFDGIKDMMKYYFAHKENIQEILVQEYYTQETINAREAFFVLGSDVYGPMGNELIAFRDKKSAEQFLFDHKGKVILRFEALTPEHIYKLDE